MIDRTNEAAALGAVPICFAPGYFVTDCGVVYSAKHLRDEKPLRRLKPGIHSQGYIQYALCIGRLIKVSYAHRLVALAFIGEHTADKPCIRHLDGNPKNNSVSNLEWGTQLQNIHDKWRHGTMASGDRSGRRLHPEKILRGSACPLSKLTEEQVIQIRTRLSAGETGVSLAKEFLITKTAISSIKNRRNWKHV